MSYAQSRDALESTASYATIWRETEWNKVKRYVNKQRRRIFHAESEGHAQVTQADRDPVADSLPESRPHETSPVHRVPSFVRIA